MQDKIDYEVFKNGTIQKAQIAEWLKKDIEGVYVLISEMLYTPEVMEALVNVFYDRYVKLHKQAQIDEALKTQPDVR